jgi:hypothetical protein
MPMLLAATLGEHPYAAIGDGGRSFDQILVGLKVLIDTILARAVAGEERFLRCSLTGRYPLSEGCHVTSHSSAQFDQRRYREVMFAAFNSADIAAIQSGFVR